MKCYKLLYDFELIKKNIGFIFMSIVFILNLILLFIYIIKGRKKIIYYIQAVLKNKSVYINNRKNLKIKNNQNTKVKDIKKTSNNKNIKVQNIKKNKNIPNKDKNGKNKMITSNKKNTKEIQKKKKNNNAPIKKSKNLKIFENNLSKYPGSSSSLKNFSKTNDECNKNFSNLNINIIPINNLNYSRKKKSQKENKNQKSKKILKNSINIFSLKKNKYGEKKSKLNKNQKSNTVLDLDFINYQTLNIQELNTLEYNVAVLVDKRTYFQYYCSLIRKKQLIIFTFLPIDDYNSVSLKISSFLLQFSLYMTVNAFFFSDNTMHQIYTDNGEMDLLIHLPLIIYSSLISTLVNTILRQLSLSESDILSIKKMKFMKVSTKRAEDVRTYLRIKIIFFFIISFILIIFFWYFISCFCAVYTNTQIILIKDSLISFGLSMVYPFGINLIPGIFRIRALRAKKKDKKCLYKFSQLLSLV